MRKSVIAIAMLTILAVLALAAPVSAITNGVPDAGRHPYVGLAVFDVDGAPSHRCSASLLSPTVVLTAGHCTVGTDAARIWFDEIVQGNPEYPFGGATSSKDPVHASRLLQPLRRRPAGIREVRRRDHHPLRAGPDIRRQHLRRTS